MSLNSEWHQFMRRVIQMDHVSMNRIVLSFLQYHYASVIRNNDDRHMASSDNSDGDDDSGEDENEKDNDEKSDTKEKKRPERDENMIHV